MNARAALGLCAVALLALPAAAPAKAKAKAPRGCPPSATAAMRPMPVDANRRGRSKAGALSARTCLRARWVLGVSGVARPGAPAGFALARPFATPPAPGGGPAPAAPGDPQPPGEPELPTIPSNPRALQVQAYEFGLQLSKASVLDGDVRVEFNSARAEDPHNLRLARVDGTGPVLGFDEQPSGAVTSKTLPLSEGRWTLFCSVQDHEARGMRATLTVAPD